MTGGAFPAAGTEPAPLAAPDRVARAGATAGRERLRRRARFHAAFCLIVTAYVVTVQVASVFAWSESPQSHYWSVATTLEFSAFVALSGVLVALFDRFVAGRAMQMSGGPALAADILIRIISCFFMIYFYLSFSTAKNLMQVFNDYVWDPFFAAMDKILHLGTDPWLVYFPLVEMLGFDFIAFFYFDVWGYFNFMTPLFVLLVERNPAILARFFAVYAFVWIGLGNVVAAIFLSGGPVYYEAMTGDAGRFAEFFAAVGAHGIDDTIAPRVQAMLLGFHSAGLAHYGSGISAFPSIHVAMATLVGLYLWSRLGRIGVAALLLPLGTQAFSVLIGWHYAVDGYASIAAVVIAWILLGRALERRQAAARDAVAAG